MSSRRWVAGWFSQSPCRASPWPMRAVKYGLDGEEDGWRDDPRLFVAIDAKGHITFTCPRQEMGQGIRTSLAFVLADELEADLSRVGAVQADGDQARYGNQNTDGSRSMRHFFMPMRRAGAAARVMLEQAAARHWGVPAGEVHANDHVLIHGPSGTAPGFRSRGDGCGGTSCAGTGHAATEEALAVPLYRQGQDHRRRPRGHHDRPRAIRASTSGCRACITPSSRDRPYWAASSHIMTPAPR